MEFTGGGGIVGLNPYGGFVPPNLVGPTNTNLAYVGGVDRASLDPNTLYGSGGFGRATDYYSATGAAYGRATGYYGDPYSATPVSPSSGAGYADRSTLSDAGQAYYDAHVARYGAPPYADNPGVQGPAGPPAPPAAPPSAFNTGAPAYNTYGQPGTGSVGNPLYDSLDPGGKAYYDAHVLRYGAPPDANNPGLHPAGLAAPAAPPGPGASVQPGPFGPGGPTASDPYSGGGHPTDPGEGAALDPSTWNAGQKAYADAHILKYGTLPGANNTTMRSLADAPPMEEAPPNSPGGLVGAGGFSPTTTIGGGGGGFTHPTDPGEGAAVIYENLNPQQQAYYDAHVQKYGTAPGANNSTLSGMASQGGAPFQSATGNAGQSPGMAPGMGGFNNPAGASTAPTDPGEGATVDYTSLNPQQQAYYNAHVAKYGTAPGANNSTLSGMSNNVGDYEQEAINQGEQTIRTLQDQVGAALNPPAPAAPAAPSDTLTGADRFIGAPTDPGEGAVLDPGTWNDAQKAYANAHLLKYGTLPGANNATMSGMADATPMSGPGSGVDAIEKFAGIDPSTGNQYPPGVDRTTGQPFIGPPSPPHTPGEGGALEFTGAPVNYDSLSKIQPGAGSFTPVSPQQQWLADQRAQIATSISDNPELLMEIAARIRTEDANSPEGQQAVFEAMLNNQIATSFDAKGNPVKGVDMLGPAYYPKTGAPAEAYQKNLALMQSNPGEFGQMREIIAKVLQGSNISQGAFGWSQGNSPQAKSDLANARLVYTSPKTGADYNVFYRPTGSSFGPTYIGGQNYWLSQMPP